MRVVVSGGGTGGHIYPALSIVRELKKQQPDVEVLYIGTERGLESKIVPAEGIPFRTIEIQGFKRSLSMENFKTVRLFLKSIKDAKKLLKDFQPDVVIGTGGYVCGAALYAAAKLHIPTIIHEQNSVAGLTNKFLSRYVNKICVCFPEAASEFPAKKVVLTGNPRAQEVANVTQSDILEEYGLVPNKPTVVLFGGSQGAATFNRLFTEGFPDFAGEAYQVLYGTGQRYYESLMETHGAELEKLTNVRVVPYIANMEQVLANVSLVVGRSGATTLAELTSLGLPSILIPSPNVTNDQQTKNANSLVKHGAAVLLRDQEVTAKELIATIRHYMQDENARVQMALQAKQMGLPDATDRILAVIDEVV